MSQCYQIGDKTIPGNIRIGIKRV